VPLRSSRPRRRHAATLAEQYAGKQSKTLTRDINALVELGLLQRSQDGRYSAQHERMFSFTPIGGGDPGRSVLVRHTRRASRNR
jgi:DNA-binding HxlR family transcriptional regulator